MHALVQPTAMDARSYMYVGRMHIQYLIGMVSVYMLCEYM